MNIIDNFSIVAGVGEQTLLGTMSQILNSGEGNTYKYQRISHKKTLRDKDIKKVSQGVERDKDNKKKNFEGKKFEKKKKAGDLN